MCDNLCLWCKGLIKPKYIECEECECGDFGEFDFEIRNGFYNSNYDEYFDNEYIDDFYFSDCD